MPCPICLQSYTSKARKEVKCQYCPEAACLPCMQQYLLSSVEDSHCFTCKRGWTTEFMNNNFPMSFRGKTLRMHRRSVLLSREKSFLPAMQVFVEAKRNYNNALETIKVLNNDFEPIRSEYMRLLSIEMAKKRNYQIALYGTNERDFEKVIETRIEYRNAVDKTIKYKKDHYTKMHRVMKVACRQLTRLERIYETGETEGEEPTRREFLMRCPGEECRGFISSSYICGTCTKKTCSDCIEIIEEGHVCKPESIESAKAIKKETRACPKCAARIFKIDGCDQMWCTMDGCNTAFSWNTGHIVSGRVHNPHYYEWLRQNGGAAGAEREAGDIPCGGLPNQRLFIYRILDNGGLSDVEKNRLLEINRCLAEFEWRLQSYPARMAALANKDINVKYLMNQISEAEWQRQLEFTEMRFIRKKEIGQILQTLVTVSADIMASIYERAEILEGAEWIRSSGLPNLESLREYTTKTLVNLGNTMRIAVPTISEIWHWNPTRIHYKKKAGAADAVELEAVDAAEPPPLDYDPRGDDTDEEIPVDVEAI